jgi:hypothetical protein
VTERDDVIPSPEGARDPERLAQNLGQRAAERLDVEAAARAVVERLRQREEQPRIRWMRPEWLKVAAALVILLGAGFALERVRTADSGLPRYALEELSDLTASELDLLLADLDSTLSGHDEEPDSDLDNLTPAQMQELLRSLES